MAGVRLVTIKGTRDGREIGSVRGDLQNVAG